MTRYHSPSKTSILKQYLLIFQYFIRCLVGKGPGFIAGIFEALSYIFVIANASSYISRIIATVFHWGLHGQVAFSAMFYSSVVLIMQNPLRFWRFVMFFAVVSVCILLMYCIGSLRHFNFLKYAPIYSESWTTGNYRAGHRIWMAGGGLHFFEIFPLAAYFFSGIAIFDSKSLQIKLMPVYDEY